MDSAVGTQAIQETNAVEVAVAHTNLESQTVNAKEALARGFAIFPCIPRQKEVLGSYAHHGCNSASTNPDVALRAWTDGVDANVGISCGMSDIAVVDADHGLKSREEFEQWREKSLPKTYAVRTGRRVNEKTGEQEFGAQLYYKGSIPSCSFRLNGVSGEVKSTGGYVMGVGSIHPISGERYETGSKSRMYSVHRLLLRAFGENAMEKRTSDYKVIVGDENTVNSQLAGDETVWKPIMMNTILDPTKGATIVVMLEHVQQAVSEGRF